MNTTIETNPSELEKLYEEYFDINEVLPQDDSTSLLQPSPLKFVESYATDGVTTRKVIDKRLGSCTRWSSVNGSDWCGEFNKNVNRKEAQ